MSNEIIATSVLLRTDGNDTNDYRLKLLNTILQTLAESSSSSDILIFPAGFLKFQDEQEKSCLIRKAQELIKTDVLICFGLDSRDNKHQLGIVLSKNRIVAMGRKFFPTDDDNKNGIIKAIHYLAEEDGHHRIFELKKKRIYMAVCNDIKGITALKEEPKPKVNLVIDLIHGFNKKGKGSSPSYFARAMANSSQKWQCFVIGSAVFFNRDIPNNWPAGIRVKHNQKDMRKWNYENNLLKAIPNEFSTLEGIESRSYKI